MWTLRVAILALLAGLFGVAPAAHARPSSTVFRGAFVCGADGRPLAGARIELWTWSETWLPKTWPFAKQIASARANDNGGWSFTVTGGETNLFIRVVLSSARAEVKNWIAPWNWFADTAPNQNDVAVQDYRTLAVNGRQCALWHGLYDAAAGFEADTGRRAPYGEVVGQYAAPTAGVPVSMYTDVWWPSGFDVYRNGHSVAQHEFGHTVRHAYDGSAAHFAADAGYYWYLRQHLASSCARTNIGFAFNEGWAEYWAGDVREPCAAATDYGVERNVAAALAKLQRDCRLTRGQMVNILAAHRGAIHQFQEFANFANCKPPKPITKLGKVKKAPLKLAALQKATKAWLAGYSSDIAQLRADLAAATKASKRRVDCPVRPCGEQIRLTAGVGLAAARLAEAQRLRATLAPLGTRAQLKRLAALAPGKLARAYRDSRTRAIKAARKAALPGIGKAITAVQRLKGSAADKTRALQGLRTLRVGVKQGRVAALAALAPARPPKLTIAGPTPAGLQPAVIATTDGRPAAAALSTDDQGTCARTEDEAASRNFVPGEDGYAHPVAGSLTPPLRGTPVQVVFEHKSTDGGFSSIAHNTTTDAAGRFTDPGLTTEEWSAAYGQHWRVQVSFAGDRARKPAVSVTCWLGRSRYP